MIKQTHPITFDKILVTGGYGTVGGYVREVFKNSMVILTDQDSMDITRLEMVQNTIDSVRPDIVFHLAAITDVDLCEKNEDLAMKVNFKGTENIVNVCKTYDIPLLYISTSAVFDGKNSSGYSEIDSPNPSNIYAKTKLLGEKAIIKTLNKYLIIRAAWMIGGGKRGKKFMSYIADKIKAGEIVRVVDDKFGTITYAKDLLNFAKERLASSEFGLYHYGCKGVCSRYDIACLVKNILNRNAKIVPVLSQEFKNKFSAPRPKYEVIRSTKISLEKSWDEVITEYITNEII